MRYIADLAPSCDDIRVSFEERKHRREAEIQALKEALQVRAVGPLARGLKHGAAWGKGACAHAKGRLSCPKKRPRVLREVLREVWRPKVGARHWMKRIRKSVRECKIFK